MATRHRTILRHALATCVVILGVLAATGSAAAAQITVFDGSGNQKSAEFSSLTGEQEAGFTLVSANGAKSNVTVKGIPISQLFEQLGDPYFSGVSIPRPDGTAIEISRDQINSVGTEPMIFESGGGLGFVRPQYGKNDANAADYFTGAGALTLRQLRGSKFDVIASIEASKVKIKAGQSVSFEGSATGGGAGQTFTYSWRFDDGGTANGQKVKHTFKKRGSFNVMLTAKTVSGERKGTKIVTIDVDSVKSKKNRSGGGNNDSAAAPASGVSDGNSGDGLTAGAGEQSAPEKKPQRKQKSEQASAQLPEVTGELLSAEAEPLQPQSSLAARSGTITPPKQGAKIDGTTVAILGTLLLLGFGFASEFGQPGNFRRRIRGLG